MVYKQPNWKNPTIVAQQASQDANQRQRQTLRQAAQVVKNQTPTKTSPGKSSRALSPGVKR